MPMRVTSVEPMLGQFFRQYRRWESVSQIALGLALGLLLLVLVVAAWGPAALRSFALIGAFGLLVVAQAVVMWANRGMVTAFTRAQRLYLAEDFAGVCDLLEALRAAGKADSRALTLLGNTYRQRALLDESEIVLREALALNEDFYFPLYGFGRTLLIQGRYAEAAAAIDRAFAQGGPPIICLDVGEAYYRLGKFEEAQRLIETGLTHASESNRRLMGEYLLYRMGQQDAPEPALIVAGLPYWAAQAERYYFAAYGQLLAEDVRAMQELSEEA